MIYCYVFRIKQEQFYRLYHKPRVLKGKTGFNRQYASYLNCDIDLKSNPNGHPDFGEQSIVIDEICARTLFIVK